MNINHQKISSDAGIGPGSSPEDKGGNLRPGLETLFGLRASY